MNFTIDLSQIDDKGIDQLAYFMGQAEAEFQEDPPELETIFQQLRDIVQAESMLRRIGLPTAGPVTFELLDKIALGPAACIMLERVSQRWAAGNDQARQVFGTCLLKALVLES